MDSPQLKPSRLKHGIVLLLCSTGVAWSAWLLRNDMVAPRDGRGNAVMGAITKCGESVRRRAASSYLWRQAAAGDILYARDSVDVGAGGHARIRFDDGRIVDVGPESRVEIDRTREFALAFLKGTFVVQDDKGVQEVTVKKDGRAVARKLPVRLVGPDSDEPKLVSSGGKADVVFKWRLDKAGAGSTEGLKVRVSRNRDFSGHVIEIEAPAGPEGQVSASLGTGRYYWRLESSTGPLSEIRTVSVKAPKPLKATFPPDGHRLIAMAETASVGFRWIPIAPAAGDEHRLEISRGGEADSPEVVRQVDARNGVATVEGLQPGLYQWRLSSRLGKIAMQSATRVFEVEPKPAPTEAALFTPTPTEAPTESPTETPTVAPTPTAAPEGAKPAPTPVPTKASSPKPTPTPRPKKAAAPEREEETVAEEEEATLRRHKREGISRRATDGIEITEPKNYAETSSDRIRLAGRLGSGKGELLINGASVKFDRNLRFLEVIDLRPGANNIVVQFLPAGGTPIFRRWTIIRNVGE